LIGLKAILQDLIPLVFLGVFGLVIWLIARSGEKWWEHTGTLAFLALFLFLGYTFVSSFVAGLRGFYFLRTLQPEGVESISVDSVVVSEGSAKSDLISTLHHVQWFASNHGGWAREVPLRVRLKSGREKDFTTAFYLRQRGAVIQGTFRTPWSHRAYDCGFSAELPDVLAAMRIPLPTSR
jgi:hypothetical protein